MRWAGHIACTIKVINLFTIFGGSEKMEKKGTVGTLGTQWEEDDKITLEKFH